MKSLITNLIAAAMIIIGYISPFYGNIILTAGLFALSGAITNWLAIHMLFERVPLLYGSGVIPNHFEEFKVGIKKLIVQEFFNKDQIESFFFGENKGINPSLVEKIDFDKVFNDLVDAIFASPMGSMLSMLVDRQSLEPLKEPITRKLKVTIDEMATDIFKDESSDGFTGELTVKLEQMIDNRLNELTPKMVKEIVQDMIRKYLGWLVIWGGVFGGLIGLIVSLLQQ